MESREPRNRPKNREDINRERGNRDDEFATHYYGNERDLREKDRIAREERASRNSDIGREPYEPERKYHRFEEDSQYVGESGRRKWRQLYNDFFNDFSVLFKKESALIRTELGEKTDLVKQGAVSITTGTIVAFVGIQAIAATIVIALGNIMPWWAAALVTGIALLLIGWGMMAAARRKFSSDSLTPYRSMESFEHMGDMLKEKKDEFTRH